MKKDIKPYVKERSIHRCHSWPMLADEHDLDTSTEEFSDIIANKILDYDDKYKQDYLSSIDFVTSYQLPIPDTRIKLKLEPGCKLCHMDHELLDLKIHYLLIKGLCDIKTIQYYLFSKAILFKSWYIKQHLKHIWITSDQPAKNLDTSDESVLAMLLSQILNEIGEAKELGNNDYKKLYSLREQALRILNVRNNSKVTDKIINDSISFSKLVDLTKINK